MIDILHVKHKEYADEMQKYFESRSGDLSEIKRLTGLKIHVLSLLWWISMHVNVYAYLNLKMSRSSCMSFLLDYIHMNLYFSTGWHAMVVEFLNMFFFFFFLPFRRT